jgi:hypothetical protein
LGSMLWSIFRDFANFRRKLAIFLKTNVMIRFLYIQY